MPDTLQQSCDAIERCYEFLLAYAAQGLAGDAGAQSGAHLRIELGRAEAAIAGLRQAYDTAISGLEPADRYAAFLAVLDRDAREALAAIQLVLAQPSISSQLVDNLNASIHLRALLTDLFLIDEILKLRARPSV
ncbi:MAG: hypothetical protein HY701_12470 [Gemmatimonadetes bacterium]|nr:hypothetical protein [Gemmatimonadota bacterium]